ncbi:MAG: hypothetical protein E6X17_05395 [Sporomusaceae bacterium]|nr:hypothetical protein [Sporomusaceae bacterium]
MTALLAVNGTLMRGLELNRNLLDVGATFVREDTTAACYRLWSIDDRHPAMLRTSGEGGRVAVEIWSIPLEGLAKVLLNEPAGLSIGKVLLSDESIVLGVLGEFFLCQGHCEITEYGSWHAYIARTNRLKNKFNESTINN